MLHELTLPFVSLTLTLSLPSSTTELGPVGRVPELSDIAKKEFSLGREKSVLLSAEEADGDFGV